MNKPTEKERWLKEAEDIANRPGRPDSTMKTLLKYRNSGFRLGLPGCEIKRAIINRTKIFYEEIEAQNERAMEDYERRLV
jgi:hypothetical protein